MKDKACRLITTLVLAGCAACATPITGVTLPDPSMVDLRAIVRLDLGNGLIWEGPELTPEEWNARMQSVPPPGGFGIGAVSLISPEVATPTPEPSTFALLAAGIAAGIWWRRRS